MRLPGQILLVLTGCLYLLLLFPLVFFSPYEPYARAVPALILFSLPFPLLGLYWTYRHSGQLILTDEAIILRHWGREQRLPYCDIKTVYFRDWHVPPNLVLKSEHGTLKFSRLVEGYPRLYQSLEHSVEALNKPLEPDVISLPWEVSLRRRFWLLSGLQLMGVTAVLATIFAILAYDETTHSLNPGMAMCLIVVSVGILVIAVIGQLDPSQPVRLTFTDQAITAHYFLRRKVNWPAPSLRRIQFKEERASFSIEGIPGQMLKRPVILTFKGHPPLTITEKRANDWGYAPERLYANLSHLYPHQLTAQVDTLGKKR